MDPLALYDMGDPTLIKEVGALRNDTDSDDYAELLNTPLFGFWRLAILHLASLALFRSGRRIYMALEQCNHPPT